VVGVILSLNSKIKGSQQLAETRSNLMTALSPATLLRIFKNQLKRGSK
jgi:hypothetical protein